MFVFFLNVSLKWDSHTHSHGNSPSHLSMLFIFVLGNTAKRKNKEHPFGKVIYCGYCCDRVGGTKLAKLRWQNKIKLIQSVVEEWNPFSFIFG